MLGYIPAIVVQCVGVLIPFVGIFVLLKKGQGNSNIYLIMANFGALIMNWSTYLLLRSSSINEALSLYKSNYIGSVLFYVFYLFFVNSFIDKGKMARHVRIVFAIFIINEFLSLNAIVFDNQYAYSDISYQYVEDNGEIFIDSVEKNDNGGITSKVDDSHAEVHNEIMEARGNNHRGYAVLYWENGEILLLRYIGLGLAVLATAIYSIVMTIRQKNKIERIRYVYLTVSEIIVMASLVVNIFCHSLFNAAPLLVSAAALCVIWGTANGKFFLIADMGRSWVLDHSENIFIILDREGRFLDANDFTKRLVPGLANLPKYSFIHDELREALFSENNNLVYEGRTYVKNVADIEIEGRLIGYSITILDMTEHYKLVEEIERERQKAIDANDAKSNFMSNMSHEIRTPMNAIVGMTEIMLRHGQDEFNSEYLKNIKSSGNALLAVVNDILDFSKIESGKLEIIPAEYEMMSVLNDLSLIFLNRIGDKPLELIYDIDPKMPLKLFGDQIRIRQVLLNIVNNGIKYSDAGYVKLSMEVKRRYGDEVAIDCAVEDTGIGIKEEDIPKLFSTFTQVDKERNRGKEGTGLGLSIAKQLVELMGGHFEVQSEYGEGSTFKFRIIQKVIDATPAVSIKNKEDIYVAGYMANKQTQKNLRKICSAYENVHYVETSDVFERKIEKLDYVFLDRECICSAGYTEKEREVVISYEPEFVMTHNPMTNQCEVEGVSIIDSPLYTLNFCLAINHEALKFNDEDEKLMAYEAPDARILVVDDNEMNRKVVIGLLEPVNCTIDVAVDGKQAVSQVEEIKYDIVLMDHMMPIMDGIEATKVIRSKQEEYYQKLPIIALSANALEEAKVQFVEAGMNDFLAKPIKTKELFLTIKKYLPEEKMIYGEGVVEDISADDYAEIPEIQGLDVKAGIENSGGLDIFNMMLGDYYRLIDRKSAMLEQYLLDGFIKDFTIEVHALKNNSRMIGALELSDMFYTLEKAGNSGDYDTIDRMSGPAIELYRSYKAILEPYAVDDSQDKTEVSTEEMTDCLNRIIEGMDGFDLDSVDEAMKQLKAYMMPETIKKDFEELESLVTDVAMEDVINLCKQMIEKLEG